MSQRIWDISPPVRQGAPVVPGAIPPAVGRADRARLPVNVSEITLSPHVGAHADAPLHHDSAGKTSGQLDLEPYLGRCRVVHAIGKGVLVTWEHLAHAAYGLPPRVLVQTYERAPVDRWDPQLAAFAPATIGRLADLGVLLVGIDTASIDPAHSKELPSHQQIRQRQLRMLENLVLDDVPEGDYELIALPLKLMTGDASPVSAILRELDNAAPSFDI